MVFVSLIMSESVFSVQCCIAKNIIEFFLLFYKSNIYVSINKSMISVSEAVLFMLAGQCQL